MNYVLDGWKKAMRLPFGKTLFSMIVARKAPYFTTISPELEHLEAGKAVVKMRHKKSVHNHIGTVHAIALCNQCEYAMGVITEATLPNNLRWLPRKMNVEYLAKAEGTMTCTAEVSPSDFVVGDVVIPCKVRDDNGVVVMTADIIIYVTEKPKK